MYNFNFLNWVVSGNSYFDAHSYQLVSLHSCWYLIFTIHVFGFHFQNLVVISNALFSHLFVMITILLSLFEEHIAVFRFMSRYFINQIPPLLPSWRFKNQYFYYFVISLYLYTGELYEIYILSISIIYGRYFSGIILTTWYLIPKLWIPGKLHSKHVLAFFLRAHNQDCLFTSLSITKKAFYLIFVSLLFSLLNCYLLILTSNTIILLDILNYIHSDILYIVWFYIIFTDSVQHRCQVWCLSINFRYLFAT